jgi:hypothetical protein
MNTLLNTARLAAPLLVALAVAAPAHAAITSYTDAATFMAAVQNAGTDSFDDLGGFLPVDNPATRSAGVYGYTVDASTGLFGLNDGGNGLLSTNDLFDTLVFSNFGAGVTAAGLNAFGTDFDGFPISGVTINVRVVDTLGDTLTLNASNVTPASFFGFTSTAQLDSLVVEIFSQNSAYATANDLVLASAVPEPSTYALMLGGLGMVGWLARRRRAD